MRRTLPNRRHCVTASTVWQGHPVEVSVGFDPATGDVVEAFADIAKGGQMQHTLSDACILASIAIQHGASLDELQKTLGSEKLSVDGRAYVEPTSPVGAALQAVRMAADGIKSDSGFFDGEAR